MLSRVIVFYFSINYICWSDIQKSYLQQ